MKKLESLNQNKYNIIYGLFAITIFIFTISSLRMFVGYMEMFTDVLTEAIHSDMSIEVKLIATLFIGWLWIKIYGLLAHWIHTGFRYMKKEEEILNNKKPEEKLMDDVNNYFFKEKV